jgi:hypothetical protein
MLRFFQGTFEIVTEHIIENNVKNNLIFTRNVPMEHC